MRTGIIGCATYLPGARLDRASAASELGTTPGSGTRSVASYDEDASTMAVAAARRLLSTTSAAPERLVLATTEPPYLDRTNANVVHAALGLPTRVPAYDALGGVRAGVGALRAALDGAAASTTLVTLADIRIGLPGSTDESEGGDGAAALLVGSGDDVVAECIAWGSTTREFLDRWRTPGAPTSSVWEERFSEHAYEPLATAAIDDALDRAAIGAGDVDRVIITGLAARTVKKLARSDRWKPGAVIDDLTAVIGNTGAAHPGILLTHALADAAPGDVIALVVLSDGADVALFRVTDAISRVATVAAASTADETAAISYRTYLTWRGLLVREPARRPEPDRPAAPPSHRDEAWKFGLTASRCTCGTRHLPPNRVCVACGATDEMTPERMADVPATVVTFTIDRLAHSMSPPVIAAVLDFDGGGRLPCELTDADASSIAIGDRVEATFRRLHTSGGVHNYFWKFRPNSGGA